MSNVKFLHQNDFGYACRCPKDGKVKVYFGNVGLIATPAEFLVFRKYIAEAYQHYNQSECWPSTRNIALQTPVHNLLLIFNLMELAQLWEVLENSALMLEVEQVFSGTNSDQS
jgi:hypothetical protein